MTDLDDFLAQTRERLLFGSGQLGIFDAINSTSRR
jgi:hypothetical protein